MIEYPQENENPNVKFKHLRSSRLFINSKYIGCEKMYIIFIQIFR